MLVAILAWYTVNGSTTETYSREEAPRPQKTAADTRAYAAASAATDSDQDGLSNWEEALWKTDVNNADSDGDGTSDGEEVRFQRDPTKMGPDDKMTVPHAGEGVYASMERYLSNPETTETDRLAIDLFRGYLNLKQNGSLNATQENVLANQLVSKTLSSAQQQTYTTFHLSIISDPSAEDRARYRDAYSATLDHLDVIREHEIASVERALITENPSELDKLTTVAAVYTKVLNQLLSTPTPEDIAHAHLSTVNGIAALTAGLEKMQMILEDPIQGVTGMNVYLDTLNQLAAAFGALNRYFETHGLDPLQS